MKNTNQSPEGSYDRSGMSASRTLVAFAAGAAAGAITAMLLTPQNGIETRKAISNSTNRIKDGAIRIKDEVTDTLKQSINKFNAKTAQPASDNA